MKICFMSKYQGASDLWFFFMRLLSQCSAEVMSFAKLKGMSKSWLFYSTFLVNYDTVCNQQKSWASYRKPYENPRKIQRSKVKWLYYLLVGMFMDKVKNFCDHSMTLREMTDNLLTTGHFWTPPPHPLGLNKSKANWTPSQINERQIKKNSN